MHRNKQIAIILPDTLQSIGLQSMLTDYFPPMEVHLFATFGLLASTGSDSFDFYFTQPDLFLLNMDFFLPRRNKTVILMNGADASCNLSGTNTLTVKASQETIIEQLHLLFSSDMNSNAASGEGNKDLSSRENDVLQLIVKGSTNKDIADKLNISLNTVLTHRKNITAKLGIKTVSGLTFYAIMNGLISGDEIEL